jgi:hypothetical protein
LEMVSLIHMNNIQNMMSSPMKTDLSTTLSTSFSKEPSLHAKDSLRATSGLLLLSSVNWLLSLFLETQFYQDSMFTISERNVISHLFATICLQLTIFLLKIALKKFLEFKEENGLSATWLSIQLF